MKVDSVDGKGKRMSLSQGGEEAAGETADMQEDYRKYMEEAPRSLGTLGEILQRKLAEKEKK